MNIHGACSAVSPIAGATHALLELLLVERKILRFIYSPVLFVLAL